MNLKPITLIACLILTLQSLAQPLIKQREGREPFVDSLMRQMPLKAKVGQLLMIAADSEDNKAKTEKLIRTIDSCQVGGVCFFKGKQSAVLTLTNLISQRSNLPLFYAMDVEWGLGMRMDDGYFFPRALALGALDLRDTTLLYNMGINIAKQCIELGININFAPSLDINLNYLNPIINSRSFGEDKQRVAVLSSYYIKGMQSQGVMAVAKHFPGHGDTEQDSHLDLPLISHSRAFIDSVDAFPFKYNIKRGLWGVMAAHLAIPALSCDSVINQQLRPASLNECVISDYLIKDLQFKGLIFTDGLNMKGITKGYSSGTAAVLALSSGIDVLLMPENTYEAQNAVLQAVEQGQLSEKLIDDKCRKVLRWKYDMGLFANVITPDRNQKPLIDNAILEDAKAIDSALSYHLLTLLRNDDDVLPLNAAAKQSIYFLPCDNTKFDSLIAELKRHHPITIADSATAIDSNAIVLLAVGGSISQNASTNYGVSQAVVSKLSCVSKQYKNTVLLLFANPYVLKSIDSLDFKAIVVAYQTNQTLQTAVGKAIFENKTYTASLPVTASAKYGVGERYKKKIPPYDYSDVAKAGLDVEKFRLIDSIANMGVSKMAYPGCQIVVYKDSSLVFSRNYGYQTYDSTALVSDTTTYDLASLTKIFATTLSVMKLFEDGKLDIDDKLSKFLPYLRKTNKANITVKEAMSHFARLKAWYPFYKEQMQAPDSLKATYDRQYILSAIAKTDLGEKNKYLYSDLGFILLGDLVEVVSKQPLDEFVWDNFYAKLGLQRTTFNPEGVISDSLIAPTENDTLWRRTLVRGQVHDQTSFLLGGVAGHAGLFSSAKEVAVLCHLLLYGSYDGVQYLKPSTIATFNHRYYAKKMNRRALGFDKPLINDKSSHCSKFASQASFGHSGFTGTYFWIDPEQNLIYVFLSNRVYPDASNNKLANLDIRTNINDLIYEALKR